MIFTTMNSVYELDRPNHRIRRLEGRNQPTPRQGKDGNWRTYEAISEIEVDSEVTVIWRHLGDDRIEGTQLSPVQQIIERLH